MGLTAAAVTGCVLFLLSVPVIQGQNGWGVTYTSTEVCALRGSTVTLRCTYIYPSTINHKSTTVQKSFWFTKVRYGEPVDLQTDSQYTGRVTYSSKSKDRTLTIRNVRHSDSAVYKFRFVTNQPGGIYTGEPGVTLSVSEDPEDPRLHVQVVKYPRSSSSWAVLTCLSSCLLPPDSSYFWFKNGEKIPAQTSSTYSRYFSDADSEHSYSCALQKHQDFPSPPVCVHGTSCNRVTYDVRSTCAPEGSSVDIYCSYNSDSGHHLVSSKLWFRSERTRSGGYSTQHEDLVRDSRYTNRVQVSNTESGRSHLRLSDLRESDSAQYRFKFTTTSSFEWRSSLPGTRLTVTALQVQVKRIRVSQTYTEAELTCHSSCSGAARLSYVWFKNTQIITTAETSTFKGWFSLGDEISCALKGHDGSPSPSVYAPKLPSVSPSAEIVEGRSVTLTCSSDANPAANYTWYKEDGNQDFIPLSEGPELVFSSVQSSDSGVFFCAAENELGTRTSELFDVDVKYAPKLPSVSVGPSAEIVEGNSVTLTCSSDANPAATYTWNKKNQAAPQGRQGLYRFTSISSEDRGMFYCTADNNIGRINSSTLYVDVQYAPKIPSVSVSPSAEIVEGRSVTLTCSSDANPAAKYTWYKKNQTLLQGQDGIYSFTSISSNDSGIYICTSKNKYGRRNSTGFSVNVEYAPKLPSVSVSPSVEIIQGSSVNLTCSSDANPAAKYTWYKEGKLASIASGQILTIKDIQTENSGNYYCQAHNSRGCQNSTLQSIVVPGSMTSVAAGSITALFLVFIFIIVFLFIRRKRSKKPAERRDNGGQLHVASVGENSSASAQRKPAEVQEELYYATVTFSKREEDPLYSNIWQAPPKRPRERPEQPEEEEDEEDVEYTMVNYKSASASTESRRPVVVDDPCALYSTVTKKPGA